MRERESERAKWEGSAEEENMRKRVKQVNNTMCSNLMAPVESCCDYEY